MWISEMKYQDPRTKTYLGSPSIIRLTDGALVGTHDYFGKGCPVNHENEQHLTSVYRSEDNGLTWWNVTHVSGAFWSGLFLHGGALYLLGTSAQYGSIVIRRSDDGGFTWTHPADGETGLIDKGGPYHDPPNYHCAPVPVLVHNGRIWRAFEDCDPPDWGKGFLAGVISAPVDADLLKAENWTLTNKLRYDQDADPPEFGAKRGFSGWLEGNVVADPDGQLWDVMRVASGPVYNKAAMVKIVDEKTIEFDPATGFIDFPGGETKFSIRRDLETGLYWSLVNDMSHTPGLHSRNRLYVSTSQDLWNWKLGKMLLWDNLESDQEKSIRDTGFQYVDWQFDGEDIIYMSRTAYDGAHNFHDANRMTFGRIRDFRLLADE